MPSLVMFGATGGLGFEVAKGLVTASGFDAKKAVVRDASSEKATKLKEMGWQKPLNSAGLQARHLSVISASKS